jgi:hypothetical protein
MLRQSRADSAFPGAHEPGKANDGNPREWTARWKYLVQDGVQQGIEFITLDKEYSGGRRS